MDWRKVDTNIDLEDISKVEQLIGTKLPKSFVNFLIENNHGRPEKPVFDTEKSSGQMIGALLNFNLEKEHSDNFKTVYENIGQNLPTGFFPFASDPSGNYLCAEIRNNDVVNICLWNHEFDFSVSEDDEIQPAENSHTIEFIADTFDDFLSKLYVLS